MTRLFRRPRPLEDGFLEKASPVLGETTKCFGRFGRFRPHTDSMVCPDHIWHDQNIPGTSGTRTLRLVISPSGGWYSFGAGTFADFQWPDAAKGRLSLLGFQGSSGGVSRRM